MQQLTRFLFLLLAFQVIASSCSSTKRRDEQGAMAKLWHNMNSHYNGYFNARELMTESLQTLEDQHVDNYTQRLEMFPFLEVENPALVKEDMDIAIEKVAIVVKKHPYSNWVDDSYLLVGQAQLVKQDYESAEKTLRFLVNEFRPRPKRKKSRAKKSKDGESTAVEEEEYVSRREVEVSAEQKRKDRLRARKEAQKEREKINRQKDKERKAESRRRKKDRKARIRARKKGIKLPPRVRDTSAVTGLENEPELEPEEQDLGPVGMITLFGGDADANASGEAYGKKSGSYLAKHRPAHQEGRLWLAWTLIKRDNYDRAQIILDDLRANRGTFANVRRKALAVQAYNYLEQGRLEEALPFLEEAAAAAKERNESARYYYIAGQLYQELSQPSNAAGMFERAIAAKPNYELELGARLNLAQNAFLSGTGSAEDAIKKLKRMAKEEKNLDYEAQILFTVAAVALRSGDEAGGAAYLREALNSPSAGPVQQLEAYKLLGDLAYGDEHYLAAKLYYDTTLTVMGETDERYAPLATRRDRLSSIADNLTQIQEKDSLLRIGLLPEPERRKWAEDLFEARRAAAAVPVNPVADAGGRRRGNPSGTLSDSDFFAYNPSLLRKGQRDFNRTWGDDRALEDNWRRSKRVDASTFVDPGDTAPGAPGEEEVTIITEDEINKLLDGIPTETADQTAMQTQLAQHWFVLGQEYRDRLENNAKALDAFQTLNARYPGATPEAESWYYQYLIHKQLGNAAKAQEFADKLKKYRGSKFEKLANEPGYAAKLLNQENKLERDYEKAYGLFEAGDYEKAHELATRGRATLRGQHPLKPRYALLLAMTTGHTQGRQAYIASLRQVVAQFANTPEQTRAKEILRLLGETGARIPGKAGLSGGGNFKESMKELHFLLIVFNDKETDLNKAKVTVAEYNKKYNKETRLRVTNVYIGKENDTPVLILRRFKNGEAAKKYLSTAGELSKEFLDGAGFDYEAFAVSQSNYREVLKARSVVDYKDWYQENY